MRLAPLCTAVPTPVLFSTAHFVPQRRLYRSTHPAVLFSTALFVPPTPHLYHAASLFVVPQFVLRIPQYRAWYRIQYADTAPERRVSLVPVHRLDTPCA
eukprot:1432495-Rhodomonas_salina.1